MLPKCSVLALGGKPTMSCLVKETGRSPWATRSLASSRSRGDASRSLQRASGETNGGSTASSWGAQLSITSKSNHAAHITLYSSGAESRRLVTVRSAGRREGRQRPGPPS